MRTGRFLRIAVAAAASAGVLYLPASWAAEPVEALWAGRDNVAKAMEAVAGYEAAAQRNPGDYETLVRASRLHYWIGLLVESVDEKGAVGHFEKGEAFAECAIDLDRGKADGYFFKAANVARRASVRGTIKGLLQAGEVRSLAQKAESLDRDFFYAGPDRLLCAYYTDLPGIFGGDLKKAIEKGRRAVESHPEFAGNRVCLAEAYFKDGSNDLARRELELAVGTPDDAVAEAGPEHRFEKGKAAALLRKIGK